MPEETIITMTGKLLNLSEDKINADLADLAFRVDIILDAVKIITPHGALEILMNVVAAYMRGKCLRMGNEAGYQKHCMKFSMITTALLKKIEERGPVWYPNAHRVGLGTLEDSCTNLLQSDVMLQVQDIQHRIGPREV